MKLEGAVAVFSEMGEAANKMGLKCGEQTEHISKNQYLPVAIRSGANSNGRIRNRWVIIRSSRGLRSPEKAPPPLLPERRRASPEWRLLISLNLMSSQDSGGLRS